jgi:hypothetical protein
MKYFEQYLSTQLHWPKIHFEDQDLTALSVVAGSPGFHVYASRAIGL